MIISAAARILDKSIIYFDHLPLHELSILL